MQIKTCPVAVKAAGEPDGADEGVFEAIVATYDVDTVGDQIFPGAFKDTIAEWEASGQPIPVVWSHKSDDPDYHIGYVEKAEERPEGLWVRGRLDLDEAKSRKVYKLLKGRRISQMSFAYDELDARPAGEKAAAGARKELHRLKVYEVGPCMIGMNQRTSLLDVKSDQTLLTVEQARAAVGYPPSLMGHTHSISLPAVKVATSATGANALDVADRLAAALDAFETELKSAEAETKAAPPGFTPKPIVARIRKLVAAAQALLDAVEPSETSKSDSNAEKATPIPPADSPDSQAAPEAAPETKAAEPAPDGTASARLRTDLALLELDVASYTI